MAGTGTYAVLGLAAAAFSLCATLRLLQLQDSEQQPEQGQMTAAEALELCANATVLLVWGAAQTLMAVRAFEATRRVSTALRKLLSLSNAWILAAVLTGVVEVDLAAGRSLGDGFYYHALYIGFVIPLIFR